jgi:ATP-binding cassette subfamily F protein 3
MQRAQTFPDQITVAIVRGDVYEGECTVLRSKSSANGPQINPLEAAAASKNKSKDVHLTNLEVSFASNRIL